LARIARERAWPRVLEQWYDLRLAGLPEPLRTVTPHTLLTPLNLLFLQELGERVLTAGVPGDFVECGVYKGGSAGVLGFALKELPAASRRLWLFDSFEGLPEATGRDAPLDRELAGRYAGTERQVRRLLQRLRVPRDRYAIVGGRFEDTLPASSVGRVALLHVDCDLYEPVRLSLETFYPRVSPGGYVVVNDYGTFPGCRAATDELLQREAPEVKPVFVDRAAVYFQKPGARAGASGGAAAGARTRLRHSLHEPVARLHRNELPWIEERRRRSERWDRRVTRRVLDLRFDRRLGTATHAVEPEHFHPDRVPYQPSDWQSLRRALRVRPAGADDVFVDFGSGKGRVVLEAARLPFRRVVGVEISAKLNDVARANVERERHRLACKDVQLVTADAAAFDVPDDMTFAYFFHPFAGETFREVVGNIVRSLERRPRTVTLVYVCPALQEEIVRTGRFELVRELDGGWIAVYASC
jgi:SAM-dependent methyltransferase